MAKRDNQKAARILVEAILKNDDVKVCKEHRITRQTLYNYRRALEKDQELLQVFQQHLSEFMCRSWADELEAALTTTLTELVRHIQGQPMFSPESVEAITKAFSALGEVAIAREVLGVAIDQQDAAARAPANADARGEGASLPN